ncbi:MAG: radical SAM protein [Pirellulaceae bacterium]|nr:radical SAM protein [Pirellulaceae bacterium]
MRLSVDARYVPSRYNLHLTYRNEQFIYNTRTGAVVHVTDPQVLPFLSSPCEESPYFSDARRLGLVIPGGHDELAELRLKNAIQRFAPTDLHLTIFPTLACNMRCVYCYEVRRGVTMSDATASCVIRFAERLLQSNRFRRLTVTWMGGEPTLCRDLIDRISSDLTAAAAAHSADYSASLITNGLELSEITTARLEDWRVSSMQVTLDGLAPSHDRLRPTATGAPTFARILAALEALVESGFKGLTIRSNLTKDTIESVDEFVATMAPFLRRYEIPLNIVPADNDTGIHPELECSFIDELDFHSRSRHIAEVMIRHNAFFASAPRPHGVACQACRMHAYVISPEGYLLKCNHDINCSAERAVGHVAEDQIEFSRLWSYLGEDVFADPECRECQLLPICMGSCAYLKQTKGVKKCLERDRVFEQMVWTQWMKRQRKEGETDGNHS